MSAGRVPEEIVIHIEWEGPFHLTSVKKLKGKGDYGLYQIYGGHPVYGRSALLYIGLACAQTLGQRVGQEGQWLYNRDAGKVEIYVGRLAGNVTPDDDTWDRNIRLAERLLIHAHVPPYNTQKSLGKLQKTLWHVHVLNWSSHRDLMPEVSGWRWTDRSDTPTYHVFGVDD